MGQVWQVVLSAKQLPKSQSRVAACIDQSLLEAGTQSEFQVVVFSRPSQLLPDSVLIEPFATYRNRANPSVPGPGICVFVYGDAESGSNDTLVKTIGIIQKTAVSIEPPLYAAATIGGADQIALRERCQPQAAVVHNLGPSRSTDR